MIHSIFILNNAGQVIIEKHYRGNATRTESVSFWSQTSKSTKSVPSDVAPFLATPKGALVHLQRNGLFFLASVLSDTQPVFVTQFLSTLADLLEDYFGEVNEHAIKDNFITVYELLDEMLDHGHPLTLEPNTLKDLIAPPTMFDRVLDSIGAESQKTSTLLTSTTTSHSASSMGAASIVPWRRAGVKYAQNEVFVDVVETVDATFSSSRRAMSHFVVHGTVRVNCRLSGNPDITMHLRSNHGALDDAALHHCVRTSRFTENGILSFIPPDGPFQLMRFAIRDTRAMSLPVDAHARIEKSHSHHANSDSSGSDSVEMVSVSVSLIARFAPPPPPPPRPGSTGMMLTSVMNAAGAGVGNVAAKGISSLYEQQDAVMDEVVVRVPFGDAVSGAALSANVGTVHFDSTTGMCTWNIGVVSRGKTPAMLGNISVKAGALARVSQPQVLVKFRIPGHSVAGVTVDSLELGTSETYRYYKGLRCITTAGIYEVRP